MANLLEARAFVCDFLTLGKFIYSKTKLFDLELKLDPDTGEQKAMIISLMDNLPLHYRRFIELFDSGVISAVIESFGKKWAERYKSFSNDMHHNVMFYYELGQYKSIKEDPAAFILSKIAENIMLVRGSREVSHILIAVCKEYRIPDRYVYINNKLIFALRPELIALPIEEIIPHILEQGFKYGLYTHHTDYLTQCVKDNIDTLRRLEPMYINIDDLNNCLPITHRKKGLVRINAR